MSEERTIAAGTERPPTGDAHDGARPPGLPHLADPRALTILTTEHWALLTARSLVYNEAFSRTGMFLTFLSASLVALGFLASASGFSREFQVAAAGLLAFDLLIGLATLGRIVGATIEEFRAVQGMNRLRHAYLEMVPGVERYLSASQHDDFESVISIYGSPTEATSAAGDVLHGITTAPGMVAMINAVVAAGLFATLALLAGQSGAVALIAGVVGFVLTFALATVVLLRGYVRAGRLLEVRFPPPPGPGRARTASND